jgi:hypothetical protein
MSVPLCRRNDGSADMKAPVEPRLRSLPHRRRQYVSLDSPDRCGFQIVFGAALPAAVAVKQVYGV